MKKFFKNKKLWRRIGIGTSFIVGIAFLPFLVGGLAGYRLYKSKLSPKKKWGLISIIVFFVSLIGVPWTIAFFSPTKIENKTANTTDISSSPIINENTISTDSVSVSPVTSTSAVQNSQFVKVTHVIDGDTIEIEGGQRIRLISVDSPETVDPQRPMQCYGKEASNFTKSQLEGKQVRLEKDVSETDKYGRLLRYVWVGDSFFNETLVRNGYAQAISYPPDVKYLDRLRAAEAKAREENKGLWNTSACPVSTSKPTPTIKPTSSTTGSGYTGKYSCTGPDLDCSDFKTQKEAQSFFNSCGFSASYDPMRLDKANGTGNGIACESLP